MDIPGWQSTLGDHIFPKGDFPLEENKNLPSEGQVEKKPPNGAKKSKKEGKPPMSKTKKKVLIVAVCVGLVLAILAAVLVTVALINNRAPKLEEVRPRFEELLLAAPAVNEMLWGEGLPTYPRIYSEGFSFKDTYDPVPEGNEKNIQGFTFTAEDGRTIVAYRAWMFFIPAGESSGVYYDFEKNVTLSAKPDDKNYYRFAERVNAPRDGQEANAYLAQHLGGEGMYYYSLADFDLNAVFFYTESDDANYDYVKESSGFLTTDHIKDAAGKVYSSAFLNSVYESLFTGVVVEGGSSMLYARYYDYEDLESGTNALVKDNRDKGYELKNWTYDFSTMEIVRKSNATFVTLQLDRYLTGDSAVRETVKVAFVKENGQWFLDSPTF